MKWVAAVLLFANLAVAGFFVGREQWPSSPAAGDAPLNVDRLSLRNTAASDKAPAASAAGSADAAMCVEWVGLDDAEFARAREQLKLLAAERVMSFTETPRQTRHWVIFPPLPSAGSAAAKRDELAAAGAGEAYVVDDGAWRHAISLGLYADREAAARRVRELEDLGVQGTRVELLPRQGTDYYFVIRSDDPDALKSLGDIRQAYPNSRQSRVACPSQGT